MATVVKYSVYPDALFMPKYPFEKAYGKPRPKCAWKSCALGLPCTPSPDHHHVRWCAKRASLYYLDLAKKTMRSDVFGIATHFVADTMCEQYEGIRGMWDYRSKSTPLSNLAEEWSRKYALDKLFAAKLKDKVYSVVNEWLSKEFVVDHYCQAWGVSADATRSLLTGARSLVQQRNYEQALVCGLASVVTFFAI